jgi:hypothetical protein
MNVTTFIGRTEHRLLLSPIGFRLIDEFTGEAPIGSVSCVLDKRDASGSWVPTGAQARRSAGGIVIFPALSRVARRGLVGAPPETFRARFKANFYIPFYRITQDGLTFAAPPYNDEEPPANPSRVPQDVVLVPAPSYPFSSEVRVLRGVVTGPDGEVADAEVSRGNTERVLTDPRGGYALPLRQTSLHTPVVIDATDHRTGRVGQITVTLPDALGRDQPIAIS